jgi:hypothetical protein
LDDRLLVLQNVLTLQDRSFGIAEKSFGVLLKMITEVIHVFMVDK